MSAIHQFVAGFTNGDAISNEARTFRDLFHSWGYESEIFSQHEHILPSLRRECSDISRYQAVAQKDDTALLHLSSGTRVNGFFRDLTCRKAIVYHNLTPPHFFENINRTTAELLCAGHDQARSLAGSADINMAVSRFDADGLEEMGYRDVKVLPLMIGFERFDIPPSPTMMQRLSGGPNVIFVGRMVPNKKIDDLLIAFHYFKADNPDARFIHVGSWGGAEPYYLSLKRMARELKIADSVMFLGSISQAEVNAVYRSADIFLCMSEHEGFCIPLLEAMHFDIPVIAYSAAAVPETLAGSGVLFTKKDHKSVAEMMSKLVSDADLKNAVIVAQRKRLDEYRSQDLASELRILLHTH